MIQLKKNKLRYNEYYNIQDIYDKLYLMSSENKSFTKLMEIITSRENILVAYRNIKKNKGSLTKGANKTTIIDIGESNQNRLISYIQNRFSNYIPMKVRRVEIPKPNGKMRPLGIPTIEDRLIQQCIKQVLEPIAEAKFHPHSYGFRPNRGTQHAIARMHNLINRGHLHYVVDVDIKGFFDNVNHGKLIKQLWTLGIKDKRLITIISKMLKAEIVGEGIPSKGTPQGGILSPLLANIVLNELDWWISDQWETFETKHKYYTNREKQRALKTTTSLKEVKIIRYADDFKIMCRDYKTAQKIFNATRKWLKERLSLEISPEKSKVVNLRKNHSEFLGFKIKVRNKGKKQVVKSAMTDKSIQKVKTNLRQRINTIKENPTADNVIKYNATVLGAQNYYKYATTVNLNFSEIAYDVSKHLYNKLKHSFSKTGTKSLAYTKFYGTYNLKEYNVAKITLYPIAGIKYNNAPFFTQCICNYTEEGRQLIHKNLESVSSSILKYIMRNYEKNQTTEFNDNRISLYVGQNGKCGVSKVFLEIDNMEVHHIIPKSKGGSDEYKNLIYVTYEIHKLIHATNGDTIKKYLSQITLDDKMLKKLNKLRLNVGNYSI